MTIVATVQTQNLYSNQSVVTSHNIMDVHIHWEPQISKFKQKHNPTSTREMHLWLAQHFLPALHHLFFHWQQIHCLSTFLNTTDKWWVALGQSNCNTNSYHTTKKNDAVTAEALSWLKLLNTILLNWFLLTWLLVEEEYVNKIAIKQFRERYQLTLRVASCQLFKNSKYWH